MMLPDVRFMRDAILSNLVVSVLAFLFLALYIAATEAHT